MQLGVGRYLVWREEETQKVGSKGVWLRRVWALTWEPTQDTKCRQLLVVWICRPCRSRSRDCSH